MKVAEDITKNYSRYFLRIPTTVLNHFQDT